MTMFQAYACVARTRSLMAESSSGAAGQHSTQRNAAPATDSHSPPSHFPCAVFLCKRYAAAVTLDTQNAVVPPPSGVNYP